MRDYGNCGVTQKFISNIAGVNPSTVSRLISTLKLYPIDDDSRKKLRYNLNDTRKIVTELLSKNISIKNKVQCFYNFKGGTGKTSICFQVSTILAIIGYKVLVVDADPQGHLSTILGFDSMDNYQTLYDVIAEDIDLKDIISNIFPGLDCVPSNLSLTKVMLPLDQMPKREEVLKSKFSKIVSDYDFVIFDTNPNISILNRNIIVFSDVLNIVCETQPLSINGLKILLDDTIKFCKLMHIEMPEVFIIPNKYEDKAGSSAEAMAALMKYYSQYLEPDTAIRKSEDLITASKIGLPLPCFAKSNSNALADIVELVQDIIKRSLHNPVDIVSKK